MANPMPKLNDAEYEMLFESIKANGVQVAIKVGEHVGIIDGHHRSKIAKQLKIPCPQEVIRGLSADEERLMQIEHNVARRHLNQFQRLKFYEEVKKLRSAIAEKKRQEAAAHSRDQNYASRQDDSTLAQDSKAAAEAARMAGVGSHDAAERNLSKAKKIEELKDTNDETQRLYARCERGDITIAGAFRKLYELGYIKEEENVKIKQTYDKVKQELKNTKESLAEAKTTLDALQAERDALAAATAQAKTEGYDAMLTDFVQSVAAATQESEDFSVPLAQLRELVYKIKPGLADTLPLRTPEEQTRLGEIVEQTLAKKNGKGPVHNSPLTHALLLEGQAKEVLQAMTNLDLALDALHRIAPERLIVAWRNGSTFGEIEDEFAGYQRRLDAYVRLVQEARATKPELYVVPAATGTEE